MCSSGGCGEPWRPGRDLALEDATSGAPDVVEDDVCGGGVVQHLQAGHHEDCGAGVLGGDITIELNLEQRVLQQRRRISTCAYIVPVPLDTIQAGLLHVELEVAVELHHVPRLDHGGQIQLLIQSNTMNS